MTLTREQIASFKSLGASNLTYSLGGIKRFHILCDMAEAYRAGLAAPFTETDRDAMGLIVDATGCTTNKAMELWYRLKKLRASAQVGEGATPAGAGLTASQAPESEAHPIAAPAGATQRVDDEADHPYNVHLDNERAERLGKPTIDLVVSAEFARRLERERDALRAELSALKAGQAQAVRVAVEAAVLACAAAIRARAAESKP